MKHDLIQARRCLTGCLEQLSAQLRRGELAQEVCEAILQYRACPETLDGITANPHKALLRRAKHEAFNRWMEHEGRLADAAQCHQRILTLARAKSNQPKQS